MTSIREKQLFRSCFSNLGDVWGESKMGELQGVNVDRQACASSKTGIAFWSPGQRTLPKRVNNIFTREERTLKTRRPTVFIAGPIRYLIELGIIIQYKKWILVIGNC
jgi:hypothetical protein